MGNTRLLVKQKLLIITTIQTSFQQFRSITFSKKHNTYVLKSRTMTGLQKVIVSDMLKLTFRQS